MIDFISIFPIDIALLSTTQYRLTHSVNLIHFLLGALFVLAALVKPHLAIGLPAMVVYNCIHDTNWREVSKSTYQPLYCRDYLCVVGLLSTLEILFMAVGN